MGFGQRWPAYEYRPKVKKLSKEELADALAAVKRAIGRSPVLSALRVEAHARRGRFYLEQHVVEDGQRYRDILGRISHIVRVGPMLEVPGRSENSWSEVAKGSIQKLMKIVASDKRGRFHGLGSLNESLRKTGCLDRQAIQKGGDKFFYKQSGERCTTQEALYHYFGVPMDVIAEPRQWYIYQRQPVIVETNDDRTKVLVQFVKAGIDGSFGGTALYIVKDGRWHVFTIKPSDSGSIAAAEAWIKKRGWKNWA